MKTVDARGLKCPMPLIETKKALKETEPDGQLKIIIDNEISKTNVMRFLTDNGMSPEVSEEGNTFEIHVSKKDKELENVKAEDYCNNGTTVNNEYIVVFAKDRVGEGDEELGKMLVGGFLQTFNSMDQLPHKIIFINSGIFLVLKDSPYLQQLEDLESSGVKIMACGTCMEHYDKTGEIAIGEISNAYDILSSLTGAGKVLNI